MQWTWSWLFVLTQHGFKNDNIHLFQTNKYNLLNSIFRSKFKLGNVTGFIKNRKGASKIHIEKDFEVLSLEIKEINEGKLVIVEIYSFPKGDYTHFLWIY